MEQWAGTIVTTSDLVGVDRVMSFLPVSGFPLHVVVSHGVEDALAAIAEERVLLYAGGAAVSLGGIAVAALLLGLVAARRRQAEAVATHAQPLSAAIDLTQNGRAPWRERVCT